MVRPVRLFSAAMLASVAVGASPGELRAQVGVYVSNADRYLQAAEAAQRLNDCRIFRDYLSLAQQESESAFFSGLDDNQRREVARKVAELERVGCPPKAVTQNLQPPPIADGVQFQVSAGVSVLEGIKVANGGLGGEQSVASPSFEVMMVRGVWGVIPPEVAFGARVFGEDGNSEKSLSGQGDITLQPDGGTQVIGGAGPVSSGTREVDFFRLGGEVQLGLPARSFCLGKAPPSASCGLLFSPFVGAGFEHSQLETRLNAMWAPLFFTVEDTRKVETNRAYLFAGARHDVANLAGVDFYVRWFFQLNLDAVHGTGVYHTMQAGVFDETVTGSASKTAVTIGGQISAGAATTLVNGIKLELNAVGRYMPVWEVEYRSGQPMTVDHDQKWGWGVGAGVRIPLDGVESPRPAIRPVLRSDLRY